MREEYSTGIPSDNTGQPLMVKVGSLIKQDVALAEGRRMQGFSARQASFGFRQSDKFIRPPEVNMGTFLDFGS